MSALPPLASRASSYFATASSRYSRPSGVVRALIFPAMVNCRTRVSDTPSRRATSAVVISFAIRTTPPPGRGQAARATARPPAPASGAESPPWGRVVP